MRNQFCLLIALLMCAVSFGKTAIPETASTENKDHFVVLHAGAGVDAMTFEAIARVLETKNKVLVVVACETRVASTVTDKICTEQLKIEKLLFAINEAEIFVPDVGKPKGNWRANYKLNKSRLAQNKIFKAYKNPRDNI